MKTTPIIRRLTLKLVITGSQLRHPCCCPIAKHVQQEEEGNSEGENTILWTCFLGVWINVCKSSNGEGSQNVINKSLVSAPWAVWYAAKDLSVYRIRFVPISSNKYLISNNNKSHWSKTNVISKAKLIFSFLDNDSFVYSFFIIRRLLSLSALSLWHCLTLCSHRPLVWAGCIPIS